MAAEAIDKAKALFKFGTQALHAMRLEDAEKALRQAAEIAASAKHERVQARALARWYYAAGFLGRLAEAERLIGDAWETNVRQGGDPVARLVLESCCLQFVAADNPDLPTRVKKFVAESERYPQDPDVARALAQVAIPCNAIGEKRLAMNLIERALPVMEAALGATHPDLGMTLHNLGDVRLALEGDKAFAKIEPLLRRAIAVQETGLAPVHPERVLPLTTLGIALGRVGRYDEAGGLLKRALEIAEKVEGPDGQTPQGLRRARAALESRLLEPPAEPYLLQSLAAAEKDPASGPLGVALKLTLLCRHYFACGKPKKAEPHYRKLREIGAGLAEPEQALLSAEMGVPGKIYALLQEDRGADAEKMLLGELEVMERILPAKHGAIHNHVYFTGNVYRMLGRHKDALRMFQRYAAAERKVAEDDPARADGLLRVLDAQLELGQKKDAERTADEIARLTGKRPAMDPALNEFARQLGNVWLALQLEKFPDLIGAAQQGDPLACLVVGLCHAAGQGVPRSMEKARPWLKIAAEAGDPVVDAIVEQFGQGGDEPVDFNQIASVAKIWVERTAAS